MFIGTQRSLQFQLFFFLFVLFFGVFKQINQFYFVILFFYRKRSPALFFFFFAQTSNNVKDLFQH